MMLSTFLVLALAAAPQELQVFDDGEWRRVDTLRSPAPALVPLLTRSPVVARATLGPRGARLRLRPAVEGEWRVRAIAHRPSERVLLVGGEPRIAGAPALPPALGSWRDPRLGALAYQDGEATDKDVSIVLTEPATAERPLLLVPAEREDGVRVTLEALTGETWAPASTFDGTLGDSTLGDSTLGDSASAAVALTGPAGRLWLRLDGLTVDQLFLADLSGPVESTDVPSTYDASTGELRVDVPRSTDGQTWTLVVDAPRPSAVGSGGPDSRPPTWRIPAADATDALVDIAGAVGASAWHLEGPDEQLDIRPTMGPGVAWGDVDDDGVPELYVVQGGGRDGSHPPENRLLQWLGESFIDVTEGAGVGDTGRGMGALFFDGDGDGDLDLYVANDGADVLYGFFSPYGMVMGGMHGQSFFDATEAAGITGDRWSAGVAAADPDRDGDLDLYVASYLLYDEALMPPVEDLPLLREDPIAMLPFAFPGERNVYWRNESTAEGLKFVDATEALGLLDAEGRGMQPLFFDFDADGAEDLYVANDVSFNVLWQGDGAGGFRDVSFQTGMDDPRGGMGVTVGDVDGDLDEDLFLTNWQLEANALYRNNRLSHTSQRHRVATFRDVTVQAGFGPHSVGYTSWGCELFDLDLDGDLDLFVANGYTSPDYESTGICVGQPNHLFLNDGEGRFALVRGLADVERELPSRAVAACDFDRDGDEDLVVTTNNGPLQLLENRAADGDDRPAWLGLELRGADANTRAIGARVTVTVGDLVHVRTLRAGRSYLGGNPPELLLGFGDRAGPATVAIVWPSGRSSRHTVELRQWTRIAEPTDG